MQALCSCTPSLFNRCVDIYGSNKADGVAEKINKYLPIKISEGDSFPKTICTQCADQLQKFDELVEKCILFEKELQTNLSMDDIDAKATLDVELASLKNSPEVDFDIQAFEVLDLFSDKTQENITSGTPCQVCQQRLSIFDQCLRHQKKHINQGICVLCNHKSEHEVDIYIHLKKHFPSLNPPEKIKKHNRYKEEKLCLKCSSCFHTVAEVVEHSKQHRPTDVTSFTCVLCMTCVDEVALEKHVQTHFSPANLELSCDDCSKIFADEKALKYHRCEVLRKFKCSDCHMGFKTEKRLKFHNEFHKTKQTFCKMCQKDFKFESRIFQHLSGVHQGERDKEYCCDVCGKTFRCLNDLQTHQRGHNDDRPFACGKCDASFFSKTSLSAHLPSHEPTSLFHCLRCNYSTNRKDNLVKHVAHLHNQVDRSQVVVRCQTCLEVFPNANHVKLEEHGHTLTGDSSDALEELVVTKLYQCERCHRNFGFAQDLSFHRSKHFSSDPFYLCRLCNAGFTKHDFLVRHQKKVHHATISKYTGKLSVLTVTVCNICNLEWVHYKQLLNHKVRGNCHKKKTLEKIGTRKLQPTPRLLPIKASQLNINAAGLFECRECQRQYKNRRRYRLHLATHETAV